MELAAEFDIEFIISYMSRVDSVSAPPLEPQLQEDDAKDNDINIVINKQCV